MNTETLKIYETPEEIEAAKARLEPLVFGEPEVIKELNAEIAELRAINNRHARRKAAKLERQALGIHRRGIR